MSLLGAFRWKILLQSGKEKNLSFIKILKISWIGLFFNSFLPGAVTGDLIKLAYVRDVGKNLSKTFFLSSILIDRIIGLLGLLCLMGIFSSLNYNEIVQISPSLKNLVHLNILFFLGALTFLFTLFLPLKWQQKLISHLITIPYIGKKIGPLFEQIWVIGKNKLLFFKCLFISLFIQIISVGIFWKIIEPFTEVPLSLQHAFICIPFGFIAMAIPISPAGLGVGHAIFGTLFSFFGIEKGASLFNFYFICMIFCNLTGAIPYTLAGARNFNQKKQIEGPSAI